MANSVTRSVLAVLSLACGIGLSACGDGGDHPVSVDPKIASTMVTPASLRVTDSLPRMSGKPVLRMSGAITRHNRGSALQWDLPTLDRLGLRRVSVYDPWAKKKVTLQGVWLADLLTASGAGPSAGVHLVALDDYKADLTTAEIHAGGIMLATRTGEGGTIPVEDGGPTRIVFVGGVASGHNPDQWIWSLKTLTVT